MITRKKTLTSSSFYSLRTLLIQIWNSHLMQYVPKLTKYISKLSRRIFQLKRGISLSVQRDFLKGHWPVSLVKLSHISSKLCCWISRIPRFTDFSDSSLGLRWIHCNFCKKLVSPPPPPSIQLFLLQSFQMDFTSHVWWDIPILNCRCDAVKIWALKNRKQNCESEVRHWNRSNILRSPLAHSIPIQKCPQIKG